MTGLQNGAALKYLVGPSGPVAELVDAPDLKSVVPKGTCWFKSSRGHHVQCTWCPRLPFFYCPSSPTLRLAAGGRGHQLWLCDPRQAESRVEAKLWVGGFGRGPAFSLASVSFFSAAIRSPNSARS